MERFPKMNPEELKVNAIMYTVVKAEIQRLEKLKEDKLASVDDFIRSHYLELVAIKLEAMVERRTVSTIEELTRMQDFCIESAKASSLDLSFYITNLIEESGLL